MVAPKGVKEQIPAGTSGVYKYPSLENKKFRERKYSGEIYMEPYCSLSGVRFEGDKKHFLPVDYDGVAYIPLKKGDRFVSISDQTISGESLDAGKIYSYCEITEKNGNQIEFSCKEMTLLGDEAVAVETNIPAKESLTDAQGNFLKWNHVWERVFEK